MRPTPRCVLAVRNQLPWHELDALRAHAMLDQAERTDHGWAVQADALCARLVPSGLDPDPLTTVARRVAGDKATDQESEGVWRVHGPAFRSLP